MLGGTEREPFGTISNDNRLLQNASIVITIPKKNSMAGREFTTVWQSLSSSVFIDTMCLRLWLDSHVLDILTNRRNFVASQATVHNIDDKIETIGLEQEKWENEGMNDGLVCLLNQYFKEMLVEAAIQSDSP